MTTQHTDHATEETLLCKSRYPEKQVLTECAFTDSILQVYVGRRHRRHHCRRDSCLTTPPHA